MGETASLISALAQLTGAGATAAGAYSQARALRSQGEYEGRIASSNAALSDLQASDAIRRGEFEAQERARQTQQLAGAQKAGFAAQGVEIGSGTPSEVVADTELLGGLDIETIRTNAFREAWGHRAQAQQARYAGKFGLQAARARARSTLLTGGAQAFGGVAGAFSTYAGSLKKPDVPEGYTGNTYKRGAKGRDAYLGPDY